MFHKKWKNRENSTKNIAAAKNYTVQTETLTLKNIPTTKSNIPNTKSNEDIFTR